MSSDFIADFFQVHEDNIQRCGLSIISVFPETDAPGFTYTIGLSDLGYPEMILVGVEPNQAATVLNHLAASYYLADLVPKAGDMIHGMLTEDAHIRVGSVDQRWCTENYLIQASERQKGLGRRPITAVQILFPDRHKTLPDQPEFSDEAAFYTPCLAPDGKWDFRENERVVEATEEPAKVFHDKLKRKRLN